MKGTAPPRPARPDVHAWMLLVLTEGKLVARDPAGVILPLVLPVLIMVMAGLGDAGTAEAGLDGATPLSVYVTPMILIMIVAMVAVINLPSHLATYRATRVLRRLAVTPAHPAMVLVAQVIVNVVLASAGVVLALGVAFAALDVTAPASPVVAALVLLLAAAALYALGLLIAAVAPSANAALAIGLLGFFGMMALGGGFAPRENLPDVLARIGELTPFGAGLEAVSAAWVGQSPDLLHVVALAVTAAAAGVLAARVFRWE